MKQCSKCKQVLPLDSFYNNKAIRTGKSSQCMSCHRENVKKYEQSEKGRQNVRGISERQYYKHIEKKRAKAKVKYAVLRGELVKPETCSRCPSTVLVEGHHPDYSKPLEVLWLCRVCHKEEHGRLKDLSLKLEATNVK